VGAPRDLGVDQGLVCAQAVRERLRRAGLRPRRRPRLGLRPLASGPVLGRGAGRELLRHATHAVERMDGVALGAGMRVDELVGLLLSGPEELAAPSLALAAASGGAADGEGWSGAALARTLPGPGAAWILRRSRPEVGFASLDVTLPWLGASVASLNAEGLAVALTPAGAGAGPVLLVQECAERFADVESALDWCSKRPVQGRGGLLLADASGEAAAIALDGRERRVERPAGEPLSAGADAALAVRLRKAAHELRGVAGETVPAALAGALEAADPGAARISLDPAQRRLRWEGAPGAGTLDLPVLAGG